MAKASDLEAEPLVDGHSTCVPVVEDNVEVGTLATQTLVELGYETVWTQKADDALAELAGNAARFDVVFSVVVMLGMNRIDLAQEIRRRHHDLPVMLTCGYSHVLALNGTYRFELLHKPYSVEQLSRILRKAGTWKRRRTLLNSRAGPWACADIGRPGGCRLDGRTVAFFAYHVASPATGSNIGDRPAGLRRVFSRPLGLCATRLPDPRHRTASSGAPRKSRRHSR